MTQAYTDILYDERDDGVARITINPPDKYNAFRGHTVDELIHAFQRAGWNKRIGAIVRPPPVVRAPRVRPRGPGVPARPRRPSRPRATVLAPVWAIGW